MQAPLGCPRTAQVSLLAYVAIWLAVDSTTATCSEDQRGKNNSTRACRFHWNGALTRKHSHWHSHAIIYARIKTRYNHATAWPSARAQARANREQQHDREDLGSVSEAKKWKRQGVEFERGSLCSAITLPHRPALCCASCHIPTDTPHQFSSSCDLSHSHTHHIEQNQAQALQLRGLVHDARAVRAPLTQQGRPARQEVGQVVLEVICSTAQ
jgi:hypothetical protein